MFGRVNSVLLERERVKEEDKQKAEIAFHSLSSSEYSKYGRRSTLSAMFNNILISPMPSFKHK